MIYITFNQFSMINNIFIITHSMDSFMRRLNTYDAEQMRFLHVDYVNAE